MYTLYIANKNYSSWSLRPWVLMTERSIPFEEKLVPFSGEDNWEAFRRFAPNGRVPCLVDGETTVWDSLAIVEYLAEQHEGVWPADRAARAWARCATAEMHSGFFALRNECSMNCGLRVRLNQPSPALTADVNRLDELWQTSLQRWGGPFLAGKEFSAADAFYAPVAFRVQTYGLELSPASAAYAERLLARPSMQRWYDAGLAERWREESHDRELLETATLLEDLRAPPE